MHFHIRGCHPLWPAFPDRSINTHLSLFVTTETHSLHSLSEVSRMPFDDYCGPATPLSPFESNGLGCSDFARHYSRNHGCFLFLWVLRWFTSPGSLQRPYVFRARYLMFASDGFPHSEIPGSQIACISPRLIAAGHVLHRLLAPRHPHACP